MRGETILFTPARLLIPAAFKVRLGTCEYYELGRIDAACPLCGALHWKKEKTFGSAAKNYRFESYCKKDDVKWKALKKIPEYLKQLLESQDVMAKKFRQDIRRCNSALAITSVNYTADRRPQLQHITSYFQIHSELYYLQGFLEARNEEETPPYA